MEASKRERMVLLGAVPILAAGTGAILTVLAQKYLGGSGGEASDAVQAVLRMPGLTTADRIKLIEAVSQDSKSFYSLLHIGLGLLGAPLAFLIARFGQR